MIFCLGYLSSKRKWNEITQPKNGWYKSNGYYIKNHK